MPEYSVIIPTLNEESHITACLERLRALDPSLEIIVADGGSSDQTVELAEKSGARVARSDAGRGVQCNAGAKGAGGDILIFLHADTSLPNNALKVIRDSFNEQSVNIGTFRLRFDSPHWFLKICGYCTRYDSIFTRFGDQGIVVRRSFFKEMGGFPPWPLFEDVEFLRRVRRQARIRSFPAEVVTSARKFTRQGPFRQQFKNGILMIKYLIGVSPEQLAKEYLK